jgi:uncharacterized lipoprotein YddW (UPF0748 family)
MVGRMTGTRVLRFVVMVWALGAGAAEHEGRALYVTRWHLTSAAEVSAAAGYAAAHGFTMLFCQVFGNGMALYDSAVAPRSHLVPAGFDALAEAVRRGHDAGLEVHAYINTVNVWSGGLGLPADPAHIVRSHPEWSMENAARVPDVDRAAEPGALVFFCPREPAFVAYVCDVVREIAAAYDVDGIHLDYTRYPTEEHCFCARHREAFRRRHGRDPVPGEPAFNRLREDDIVGLVSAIRQAAAAENAGLRLSAALLNPSGRKGQDAQRWLEAGLIDMAVPMLYTADLVSFESSLDWFNRHSGGRHVLPAINAGLGAVGPQIDAARGAGAEGVAIFAFNVVTQAVTAELDARFDVSALPLRYPWLDGSPDTVPPVISAVRATFVGAGEATVLWHTDEKTLGAVDYGLTGAYGFTESVGTLRFDHAITLGTLAPERTYHVRVRSKDAAGNESRGDAMTFQTTGEAALEIVIDDGDVDALFTGTWGDGTSGGGYGGDYRWASDQTVITATVTYRPFLPRAGDWEVAVTYVAGDNRVSDAPYTVEYDGGRATVLVNQKTRVEPWVVLGAFSFVAGTDGHVLLTNRATGGDAVVADAVRWRYVGPPPNPSFIRGDANGDDTVDIADAVTILGYLFLGDPAVACLDALDVSDIGVIDISCAIRILTYFFASGDPPLPPFPGAGYDPTPSDPYTCGD